jgi:hypothetical protein
MANGGTIAVSAVSLSPIPKKDPEAWVEIVEREVRALKFGAVQITIHDGRVVQIETSSKIRFDRI